MVDIMVIGARGIPDIEGGAEKHAENTFPLLVRRGYSVELVGIGTYIKQTDYKGVKLTGLPTFSFMKSDKAIYNLLALAYAAIKRPRLVHLQGTNSALFLFLYKLLGLRAVLRFGSSDSEFDKWSPLQRRIIRCCEQQLALADHVIVVSENFRRRLQSELNIGHVSVVPNGIDPIHISKESQTFWETLGLERNMYFLSVGRLTVDKDFETLIDAVEALPDKNIKLVIAGGKDEPGYAERLQARSSDRIHLIGRINRSLLSALYQHCSVYVNCSQHEGLSNALLEAISYHRPVVVSRIAANLEMPLPAISYFRTGDAADLKAKLERAIAEPEKFVANAEAFYSWENVADATHKIYHALLNTDSIQDRNALAK
jgi:glycosyltransferase involved in cell wall biosynthesis